MLEYRGAAWRHESKPQRANVQERPVGRAGSTVAHEITLQ
jgi:hypothetical protein